MKRKRRIATREVYKWKARINIDGSKQVYGVHYNETYSPVVAWPTTRFFLTQSLLHNWKTKQIDFVLAFPQAPVERDLYMEIPKGIRVDGAEDGEEYVLQLVRNLYGQKQAGRVWYQYLVDGLLEIGFTRSNVDECVFYYKNSVLLVYVDDSILMGSDNNELAYLLQELQKKFKVQEEGDLCDYLGIEIKKEDGGITLTQPQLIESILKDLKLDGTNIKSRSTPALKTRVLHKDDAGTPFDESFHYRSVIGKLNYLEKSTRPDISHAVHQCARFSASPKQSYAMAVRYIARYLAGTKDKGIRLSPDTKRGYECFVDASHAGDWKQQSAIDDPVTAKSRTGYIITFAGCPIVWVSKLQTEIALSTTEAEYIALSSSAREILPMITLAKEAAKCRIIHKTKAPLLHCKLFEDNKGAIEMANVPKMRPRTKHLNIKYHFFRQYVQQGILQVLHISGTNQVADIFTKALDVASFHRHRRQIMGW
jgi:hypothetical protein